MKVSGYIPCYNNASTIAKAIVSLQEQTVEVDDLYVIDDGSSDNSVEICQSLGVNVIKNKNNYGRGYVRNLAIEVAKNEYVLCCDATNRLDSSFLENALPWFEDSNIGVVYGLIRQETAINCIDRWRGIYLFKERFPHKVLRDFGLITYGTVVRKSCIQSVGNFRKDLTHSEDIELGRRLVDAGYQTLFDPALEVFSMTHDSFWKVLERYWRWYAGEDEVASIKDYVKNIWYSISAMARNDIKDRDWARALISLVCPHYQFWRSFFYKQNTR